VEGAGEEMAARAPLSATAGGVVADVSFILLL